jgi:hypothetical protein
MAFPMMQPASTVLRDLALAVRVVSHPVLPRKPHHSESVVDVVCD